MGIDHALQHKCYVCVWHKLKLPGLCLLAPPYLPNTIMITFHRLARTLLGAYEGSELRSKSPGQSENVPVYLHTPMHLHSMHVCPEYIYYKPWVHVKVLLSVPA